MRKYRKRPVELHAEQLTLANMEELREMMQKDGYKVSLHSPAPMRAVTGLVLETLEGNMVAQIGDYIIKGIQGEYYPCKPDIFEKSNELVTEV